MTMGDSQSAELFGKLFEHFAEVDDTDGARKFYLEARGYDFSTDEMLCNEALEKLGLARRVRKMSGDFFEYFGYDYGEWSDLEEPT